MADFDELHRVIHSIASGFEEECIRCMEEHKNVLVDCIQEQLYSGLDGTEHLLNPDYDTDTYFNEPGPWQNRAEQYKRWKERITPPLRSEMLYLPPRPVEVPNLFITGTFYDSITADRIDSGLRFSTKGFTDGSSIEKKYGEQILGIGDTAKEYFNIMYLRPWMDRFLSECGYRSKMACGCEIKMMQSELERISDLAKKAAVLDGCMYVVYQKEDGTYAFDKLGVEIKGKIVEYRHYL